MSYTVIVDQRVEKDLENLPLNILKRVDTAFLKLADNPRPKGATLLQGTQHEGWRETPYFRFSEDDERDIN